MPTASPTLTTPAGFNTNWPVRTRSRLGVIAARTSKIGMSTSDGTRSTPYATPFGLMRETSLSREVVDAVAERLKRAGLLEVVVDDQCGYESWWISEPALVAASSGSKGVLSRSRHA